ncbi:MAG: protein-export chaperone SecB [Gammaproteobacteria bacterium]
MSDDNPEQKTATGNGGETPKTEATAGGKPAPIFRLENILIKNLSLETPAKAVAPALGKNPTMKMEMRSAARRLSRENYYEVTLDATCRLLAGEETCLLVEASQAGVVCVENADPPLRDRILNIHAPEMIYPYVCQLAGDLLMRAGAPRLFLPPFNFRALYEQKRAAMEKKLAEDAAVQNKTS